MRLKDCQNFHDFRKLAKKKLPSPIFHYIDGAAEDETTYRRNTSAYEDVDLIPNVLRGVEDIDLSTTIFGKKLALPFYCSPTALQRLFHHQGERAVAKAAEKYGTMFGLSTIGTVPIEELSEFDTPKMFQFYYHKDHGINDAVLDRVKASSFDVIALTVDTITSGNRERDLRTGFTSPPKLTLNSLYSFISKPMWGLNYVLREKFELPLLKDSVGELSNVSTSIGNYFSTMLDQSMSWDDAEKLASDWGKDFALKGVVSVEDAKRAVDIGCTGIVVSNHGGRQLDGQVANFDILTDIVDAVGDKIDVMCEGGLQRSTHMLKVLSIGAKAVAGGRLYLYALAAAGQAGVEKALGLYKTALERDMKLMGCTNIGELSRKNLRFR